MRRQIVERAAHRAARWRVSLRRPDGGLCVTITDIYSKRGKPTTTGVLRYDLPDPLRVQITRIVNEVLSHVRGVLHGLVVDRLARELGQVSLTPKGGDPRAQVAIFIEREQPELVLSLLDTVFSVALDRPVRELFSGAFDTTLMNLVNAIAVQAQEEMNHRFREHGVGYRIENFKAVRIGSELLHEEVMKPAMTLLREPHFAGADAEFRKALGHYRHGEYEDAITECHKALESTLKVICGRRGWPFNAERVTAKQLRAIVFEKGLIPSYLQGQFGGLHGCLAGPSTIRNRSGGHGAGAKPREVPEHLAAYMVHQTAAAILYLAESEKRTGR